VFIPPSSKETLGPKHLSPRFHVSDPHTRHSEGYLGFTHSLTPLRVVYHLCQNLVSTQGVVPPCVPRHASGCLVQLGPLEVASRAVSPNLA